MSARQSLIETISWVGATVCAIIIGVWALSAGNSHPPEAQSFERPIITVQEKVEQAKVSCLTPGVCNGCGIEGLCFNGCPAWDTNPLCKVKLRAKCPGIQHVFVRRRFYWHEFKGHRDLVRSDTIGESEPIDECVPEESPELAAGEEP